MQARSPSQLWLAVAGVLLATMMQAIDGSIVNVALPRIQRDLGGSLVTVGWTVTGYAVASLIAMPLAAGLSRRAGLRTYFVVSIALFTAASGACALSHSAASLIAFRVAQGLAAGGLLPLSQGVLMTLFAGERRGTAVALIGLAAVLGPLLGPPIGGVLTDRFGWPSIFWINFPVGLVSAALLAACLRQEPSDRTAAERLDLRGVGLLTAAVVLLQLASAHHAALFVPALAAGALFVRHERRTPAPAVDLGVLRHRPLAGTLAAAPLYGVGLYGSVFLAPLLLEHTLGMSATDAGFAIAAGGVGSGTLIAAARPLLRRFRPRSLCGTGAVLFATSMLLHARLALHGAGEPLLPQALRGAGTGLLYVGMNGFAFDRVPEAEIATSASLFYVLRQLGGAMGVALCAGVLDRFGEDGVVGVFVALALTAPLSLLPMAAADPARDRDPEARPPRAPQPEAGQDAP